MPYGQSLSNFTTSGPNSQGMGHFGGGFGGGFGGFLGDLVGQALPVVTDLVLAHNAPSQSGVINVNTAPSSLPPGSTGTAVGNMSMPSSPKRGVPSIGAQAQGLYRTTPCGNLAANQVVFQNGPNGELFAGAVKRISFAKLKRHIMSQIRSTPRRCRPRCR